MLARVPIISAYDPRRESMLAYASPSYEIAMTTIGPVNNCLGQFCTPIHNFTCCSNKIIGSEILNEKESSHG